jgi:dipeptidyl aminopeptidase/acylaminoacyl peptidase
MSHRSIAETIIGSITQASSPVVSPDGTLIAFVVTRTDLAENTYRSQVWLASADGSMPPHALTGGDNDEHPTWSPDGATLAFASKRSEKATETTMHLMPIGRDGESRTIATMPDGIGTPTFSPDGSYVAFTSRTRDARYDAKDERWQSPRKVERFFGRLDNEGWIFDRPQHIYVVRSDGSSPPQNLTPDEFQHGGIAWTPDSSAIVTSAQRHETWDLDFASDLYRVGLDGSVVKLTTGNGRFDMPSVSPDGSVVAFLGADDSSTYPQNMHVGLVAIGGGAHRFVSTALDRTFETTAGIRPPAWQTATTLLATAEDRGQTHLYRVQTDGADPVAITSGAITVKSFDAVAGTTVATIGSVDGVSDVFVIADAAPRRLTDFASRYVHAAHPQTWERIAVPSTDGTVEIDAWVMQPVDFDPAVSYPVILNVHGGPHTQYGETLFDEAQFQVAAGFVVVMCNPRGASGREQSWGQAIMGPKHPKAPGTGWGSVDVDDVLAVLDHVLTNYTFCDPDRVGMQGGSYGGFMATWLAGRHSDRFRGICSERAVNNMLTEEWTSDIGSIFRVEHGPSHIDDPEAYTSISPSQWIKDIVVPMLLIHSENDLRCPINQAEELFMGLRLLGRDVTFYRFPGEGHELSRSGSPLHRVQRAEIILDWFADKLAPRIS